MNYEQVYGAWGHHLPEQVMDIGLSLCQRVKESRQAGETIYPEDENIFRALRLTPPESVRAVILGQDPYHGAGQASGLSFSVQPGCPLPPSLKNIFTELQSDLGVPAPATGDLTPWAKSGVLLLNTVLTVSAGEARSHHDWGWQDFTTGVLRVVNGLRQPVVFILWGGDARVACAGFVRSGAATKTTVWSSHPSPLSAYRGFLGSRPFSQTNRLLSMMGGQPVDWTLPGPAG